jgi:4-amino-4-deoxy-L-arabinose transferase-like glycosyltransferase
MRPNNRASRYLILGFILLNGLLLRVTGLEWGVPRAPYWKSYHPDESVALSTVLKMSAREGNLNPHYFVNPTFHYYLIGAVWRLAGSLEFVPTARDIMDEAPTVTLDKTVRIWLLARMISVILGVLTIWLTYLLGRHLQIGAGWALISAWLAAVMPTMVIQSHYLTVDAPAGFWLILTLLLLLLASRQDGVWRWAAAGAAGGVAAATKYNVLAGIVPVAALLIIQIKSSTGGNGRRWGQAAVFIIFLFAGFLLGCPYSLLSFGEWREGINGLLHYNDYAADWLFPWLVTSRLSLGWPAWLLFLSAWAAVIIKPDRSGIFLAAGTLPFFIIYGYKASPFMRHMVPVVPLLVLLIVYALEKALGYFKRPALTAVAAVLIVLSSGYALVNGLAWIKIMNRPDTREEAAEYVKGRVTPGSAVGLAGRLWFYTPPLDEEEYRLIRLDYQPGNLGDNAPSLIIISEYEAKQFAFCRVPPEVRDSFMITLKERYRVAATFSRVPRCCGLEFKGYPLADWNYFYPEITVYERCY